MEFTLLWAALTGVGLALLMAKWEMRLGLIPEKTGSLSDLLLGAAVTSLIWSAGSHDHCRHQPDHPPRRHPHRS